MVWTSFSQLWRQREANWRLKASKCKKCGTIAFPPRRICWQCGAIEEREDFTLSRKGKIVTYCVEMYVGPGFEAPLGYGVVECDSGGRLFVQFIEADFNKEDLMKGLRLDIGQEVELVIRKISKGMGIENYGWKARAVRLKEGGE